MKKQWLVITIMALVATLTEAQPSSPSWPAVSREMKPGSRWWWMGSAVDEQNLKRNMTEYARTGLGTLEITPIYGVTGNESKELSYLSDGWFSALGVCQQTGDQQDMDIDMNGGTGWPFGGPWVKIGQAAGKLVTKSQTATADGTSVLSFDVRSPEGNASLNKVMAYQQDGSQEVVDVTAHVDGTTLRWQAPAGEWLLLAIFNGHTGQQVKRAAPGGEGYVLDHYDADAVKSYLDHFDQRFAATGARWPHSFFNDSYEVYGADWTPKMFDEFLKYRGYPLEEHMDQLLGLGKRKDGNNQILADYRQTLGDMLLNNFTRQWTAWAHTHGVTTRNQGHGSPGNLIDVYAAVDIPEIEGFGISDFKIRGLRTDPGFTSQNLSDFATLKYASSAAHVTGKTLVSSETFTWLAEHFRVSLSQMKPDLDLMFLAGVNHIFFHGTTYSPQEAAWPGWKFYASIDMSSTNTIWRDAPSLMQYATRCQSFLQMGQPDNDLLVYAPFYDAMHKNTGANSARLQLFDINTLSEKIPSMVTAVKNIEAAGLDCDFISDELLLTTTVVDGQLQTAAGTRYKALVLPQSVSMPEAVQNHIAALKEQGAQVTFVNALESLAQGEEMRTRLGLRAIRRKAASGYHYFIANLSAKDIEGFTSLAVPFKSAWIYDPVTGDIRQASLNDGKVWLSLKSGQSIILQTHDEEAVGGTAPEKTSLPVAELTPVNIDTPWTLSFTDSTYAQLSLSTYALDKPTTWERLDAATQTAAGTGVYETSFEVSSRLMAMANGGLRLDLGDVRESARVYLNDRYVGCAWSAPFVVDVTGFVREGANKLRIEVTNLPANRIRQMDIDGVQWRRFKDVNILDIVGGNTSQSGVTYNNWELVPSGLNGSVRLVPLRLLATELTTQLVAFSEQSGDYYPTYRLTTPSGLPVQTLTVTDASGRAVSDYVLNTDRQVLTLTGQSDDYLCVTAIDTEGGESQTYLRAYGAYSQQLNIDFTQDVAPACDWQVMTNTTSLNGFNGSYVWRRAPLKNSAKEVQLYEGVTALCEKANYYFYYPGYGMAATNDFTLQMQALQGDVCLLSYLVGSADKPDYVAADSLLTITEYDGSEAVMTLELPGRSQFYVYRMMQLYRPKAGSSAVNAPLLKPAAASDGFYTLQGLRVSHPRRGLYLRKGRKVLLVP